jgi:hypothetical protein
MQAGLAHQSQLHLEVGLACMVRALFETGNFEDLFLCLERISQAYERYRTEGTTAYVSIRQRTSAYVSVRQRTSGIEQKVNRM